MPSSILLEFALVFGVILGFEFLDRTNFALIGLATREPPLGVWIGAVLAFAVTTVLAVLIGSALELTLRGELVYVRLGGAALLLGYAAYLYLVPESERRPPTGRSAIATAFSLMFLLELGDTTMILTALFVTVIPDPIVVGVAATLALSTVAATACLLGSRIKGRVDPAKLDRAVIVVLVIVGIATILYALFPASFPSL